MSLADDIVEVFAPWLTPELEDYLRENGSMFEEVETLAFETEEGDPGWGIILDLDRARTQDLPYLAQYIGERIPVGLSDAASREWISDAPNMRRGTLLSIAQAAQRTLTGARLVWMSERDDGAAGDQPDDLMIVTYTSQTPDSARVLRDIYDVVPADISVHYTVQSGASWAQINASYASWSAVAAAFDSWAEVAAATPSGIIYGRP